MGGELAGPQPRRGVAVVAGSECLNQPVDMAAYDDEHGVPLLGQALPDDNNAPIGASVLSSTVNLYDAVLTAALPLPPCLRRLRRAASDRAGSTRWWAPGCSRCHTRLRCRGGPWA